MHSEPFPAILSFRALSVPREGKEKPSELASSEGLGCATLTSIALDVSRLPDPSHSLGSARHLPTRRLSLARHL